MPSASRATAWAEKAAALYDADYARRYRAHDEELPTSAPCMAFVEWLQHTCRRFRAPIDVLDLGCGTGRYFWALEGVRTLVGIDASAPMLAEARHPFRKDQIRASEIRLIHGDLFDHDFSPARFDLVYSVGVLAEHVPFDARVVARVRHVLKAQGRFAFTTVHPESHSIPRTLKRRVGQVAESVLPVGLKHIVHERLLSHGLYADEQRVQELLTSGFIIESLDRIESEAHLHCLCVARKAPAAAATSEAHEHQ